MCVGDAQDAQDDAVCASASGRNFFFGDLSSMLRHSGITFRRQVEQRIVQKLCSKYGEEPRCKGSSKRIKQKMSTQQNSEGS